MYDITNKFTYSFSFSWNAFISLYGIAHTHCFYMERCLDGISLCNVLGNICFWYLFSCVVYYMKKTIIEKALNLCHTHIDKKRLIIFYLMCLIYNVAGLFFFLVEGYKLLAFINILSIIWIVYDIIIIRKRRV
jgi:hypothetical protein